MKKLYKSSGIAIVALSVAAGTLAAHSAALAQGTDRTPTAQAEKAAKKGKIGKSDLPPMPGMSGMSGGDSMKMSGMTAVVPLLKEKGVITVKGDENWDIRTGFGRNGEMAGMMILMMTEGAGMEHMKMGAMNMDFGPANFTETPEERIAAVTTSGTDTPAPAAPVGSQSAGEPAAVPKKAPASAAKPQGGMAGMVGMDSGTPAPANAPKPAAPTPPAGTTVTARTPFGLRVTATIGGAATVGDNNVTITLRDAQNNPVTGAKITASVAMTSMDMGTTTPTVKETGNGKDAVTVNFSMSGPWRLSLKVSAGGKPAETANLDFVVRKK